MASPTVGIYPAGNKQTLHNIMYQNIIRRRGFNKFGILRGGYPDRIIDLIFLLASILLLIYQFIIRGIGVFRILGSIWLIKSSQTEIDFH